MSGYNYLALIQGGIGDEVWDKEFKIIAADFQDASTQAIGRAEDLGGHVVSVDMYASPEAFHPLHDSDLLNQPGSTLRDYRVEDHRGRASYVSQRLLKVVLLTYLKHHKMEDVIGWDDLGDELHAAICEAIGDDEFCKWNDTTSKA